MVAVFLLMLTTLIFLQQGVTALIFFKIETCHKKAIQDENIGRCSVFWIPHPARKIQR
jgi:hypothetical protein